MAMVSEELTLSGYCKAWGVPDGKNCDMTGETPRVLSGEIMTGNPPAARPERLAWPAAIYADFEIVSAPVVAAALPGRPATLSAGGLATLRPSRRRAFTQRGTPLFWLAGLALAAASFWASGGHAVVLGATGFADGPALRLTGVTSRVEDAGTRPMLIVDGEAVNDGDGAVELPALAIEVAMTNGAVLHYRLGTAGRLLAPAERFGFSSRLDLPKNKVRTVSVAFAE